MADEPQFHMTVVTQKRRKVDRAELLRGDGRSGASGERTHDGAQGAEKVSAREASGVIAAEGRVAAEAGQAARLEGAAVLKDGTDAAREAGQAASTEAADEQGRASGPEGAGSGQSGSGSRQRSSRRRYKDYGTVDLGSLRDSVEEERDFTDDPNGPTPTQGELQRQFYRKYDAILNRRYFNRNRTKLVRALVVILLVAVVFFISLFAISSLNRDTPETLEPPEVSTIPVETIDLG